MHRKKFERIPVGLKINHVEQEIYIAHIWNQLIDEGKEPTAEILATDDQLKWVNKPNHETGLSLVNTEHVEVLEGKRLRLTQKTIDKCDQYFQKYKN
jgi:hypothetical protein